MRRFPVYVDMSGYRKQRIADLLLSFLAEEIRRLNDPRLEFVTVTGIEVSGDLKNAKIFWALPLDPQSEVADSSDEVTKLLPSEERKTNTQLALKKATGLLKKRIGAELNLRYVPHLTFEYDASAQAGSRIEFLLKKAGL